MTRIDIIPAARDEDTQLIERLLRDRYNLLRILERVKDALRLPSGIDHENIVTRIQEITNADPMR
jgi:hypothetical protein